MPTKEALSWWWQMDIVEYIDRLIICLTENTWLMELKQTKQSNVLWQS